MEIQFEKSLKKISLKPSKEIPERLQLKKELVNVKIVFENLL